MGLFWHLLCLSCFGQGFDTTVDFWDWNHFTFLPDLCYHLYFDFEDWFKDHYMVIINYFMLTATLVGALGSLFQWKTPQAMGWLFLSCWGYLVWLLKYWWPKLFDSPAYKLPLISLLRWSFPCFWSIGFIDVYLYSILGMILIVFGLVLNGVYKRSKESS